MRKVMDKVVGKVMHIVKFRRRRLVKRQDDSSALWHLPVEILSLIFDHCLLKTDYPPVSPESAPILLTRICRRWREILVNTPSLWCRLSVIIHPDSKVWQKKALCYDLWLKRSQGRQLSLAISCSPSGATELQSLLHPYNTQISSLELLSDDAAVAAEHLLQNLPALQDLTLQGLGIKCIARLIQLPCILRNLKLERFTVNPFESFPSCNMWAHVTVVEIVVYQPHEFLHLLNLCPNLSSLDISLNSRDVATQPLQPCMHTNLRSLSIRCLNWTPCSLPDLFNMLTLPSLRIFGTCCPCWPHEEFKDFLAQSNHPLKSLIFGAGMTVTDEQQAEYLTLIPSLEFQWPTNSDSSIALYCS